MNNKENYEIDDKLMGQCNLSLTAIVSNSNVKLKNININRDIKKWKQAYEQIVGDCRNLVLKGTIENEVDTIINLSLQLFKKTVFNNINPEIYKLAQSLFSIYKKCGYLELNYEVAFDNEPRYLPQEEHARILVKFYLLRIAYLFESSDMMNEIFLDGFSRLYFDTKKATIRNISITLELEAERLELLLLGIASKCFNFGSYQVYARMVYRDYLGYKDSFAEFPRVIFRNPFIQIDSESVTNNDCLQGSQEKEIIVKLVNDIKEFLALCEEEAIRRRQYNEEMKQYYIQEKINAAEKEARIKAKELKSKDTTRDHQDTSASRSQKVNLLREIGYEASLPADIRHQILVESALPMFGERSVGNALNSLIEREKKQKNGEQRYRKSRSLLALEDDIEFVKEWLETGGAPFNGTYTF